MRPEDIFKSIADLMRFGNSMTVAVDGNTSTITTPQIYTLTEGMLVEIGSKVYAISNIATNGINDYSFDVQGVGITAETWQLALYYEFGHSVEIGNTLKDKKEDPINKNKRFPLMWLSINIEKSKTELGFSAPITIAFIYLSEKNLKAGKRIDTKFEPILDPLVDLFEIVMNNSPGSRFFYKEFGETLEITKTDKFNYGSVEGKNVFADIADATQLDMNLNFFALGTCSQ